MNPFVPPALIEAVKAELECARAGALVLRTPRLTAAVTAAFSRDPAVAASGAAELQRMLSESEGAPGLDVVWWRAAAELERRNYAASRAICEALMEDAENERAAALHAVLRAAVVAEADTGLSRLAWAAAGAVTVAALLLAVRRGGGGGGAPARAPMPRHALGAPALPRAAAPSAAAAAAAAANISSAAASAAVAAAPYVDSLTVAATRAFDTLQAWAAGKR
jgi:hypothetical protein